MYSDLYSEEITRKLSKLKKKDIRQYIIVRKKMDQVLANPEHRYKEMRYDMKGIQRVHIGHFVLIFTMDHTQKIVSFEDYDHHDNIYRH
jgi:mRNA-degrading endonuclease RelE of RelBE toxin-antitoxin system